MPRLSWKSTVIESDPTLPVGSVAVIVIRFDPAMRGTDAVQDALPVAVPEAPFAALVQATLATLASSDAAPPRSIGVEVVLKLVSGVGDWICTEGGALSAGLKATVIVSVPLLPAASCAVIVRKFPPGVSGIDALHDVVPVAVPEAPVAAFDQVTAVTPRLSEAVPPRATGAEVEQYDVAVVGDVIVTVGGVVSGGE